MTCPIWYLSPGQGTGSVECSGAAPTSQRFRHLSIPGRYSRTGIGLELIPVPAEGRLRKPYPLRQQRARPDWLSGRVLLSLRVELAHHLSSIFSYI
ncbi:hypothetical protein BOTBODRAFT_198602 [Botryobasidium botryosum FD-172 SS1]|uniref:Uncharacterized protein n=1 Tax=Botryobasidium botryosum (strain FD-172 SS1) TaxID=930990 RepID=A0A067N0H3_BOTB1|nr:hypothetical protein BOTBODRAFT_198602 [Botryobasidium botryosum FD-172 SS1]